MNRRNKSVKSNKFVRKNRLKTVYAVIFIVLFWYLLIGNELITNIIDNKKSHIEMQRAYLSTCTEANLSKIISMDLGMKDDEDIEDNWYSKDYKYIHSKGIESLREEDANKLISEDKLKIVLEEVIEITSNQEAGEVEINNINSSIEKNIDKSKDYISINELINIYRTIIPNNNLVYKSLTILETPATNNQEAWRVLTNEGEYGFKGLIVDPVINKTIEVAVNGDEILGVIAIQKDESVLDNCIVREIKEGKLNIEIGELKAEINTPNIDEQVNSQIEIGREGRLVINKEGFVSYIPNDELIDEREAIESTDGSNDIEVNSIKSEEDIRVVITDEYKNYTHNNVKVISTDKYNVICGEEIVPLPALQVWNANEFDWQEEINKISLVPVDEKIAELKLLTVEKSQGFPKYKGVIEVKRVGDEYEIVNEVGIEDYVANVIPSEMPVSYGLEALKVQAVSARTYAMASKDGKKFEEYDADLDDTTSSQVYNNQLPDQVAYEATSATKGEVVKYEGNLLSSKFFATSCGYTANYGEVWASGEEFPTYTPPYLSSCEQYKDSNIKLDMKNEDEVIKFFKLKPEDIDSFDEKSPWFRWQTELSNKELSTRINTKLLSLIEAYPNLIKAKKEDNWVEANIESIGDIKNIEVTQRGQGGNIMTMVFEGSENTIQVSTEYIIRTLIAGGKEVKINVDRINGSNSGDMSMLPSAFFAPEITYDENNDLESVVLYGGGFGHGVGMSQDGVLGMIEDGYDYKDVLEHYYQGIEIGYYN